MASQIKTLSKQDKGYLTYILKSNDKELLSRISRDIVKYVNESRKEDDAMKAGMPVKPLFEITPNDKNHMEMIGKFSSRLVNHINALGTWPRFLLELESGQDMDDESSTPFVAGTDFWVTLIDLKRAATAVQNKLKIEKGPVPSMPIRMLSVSIASRLQSSGYELVTGETGELAECIKLAMRMVLDNERDPSFNDRKHKNERYTPLVKRYTEIAIRQLASDRTT